MLATITLVVVAAFGLTCFLIFRSPSVDNPLVPPQNYPKTTLTDGRPAIVVKPGTSQLAVADVQQYVTTHPFPGGPTASGQPPIVVTIQLVTSQQASVIMGGESTGLPDNAPVYYVKLQGPFLMENEHLLPGATTPTSNLVEEVFDAHTGNLLVWGSTGS